MGPNEATAGVFYLPPVMSPPSGSWWPTFLVVGLLLILFLRWRHRRDPIRHATRLLRATLTGVCESHGLTHAVAVMGHALGMINASIRQGGHTIILTKQQRLAILLAALLHDADDRKLFPKNLDYENARRILGLVTSRDVAALALRMIKLVSASQNGDTVPDGPCWLLIPRMADRLEAIGPIGVERCLTYTLGIGRPIYTPETLRATGERHLFSRVAPPSRYRAYCSPSGGKSASMIDHYYDKLIHLFQALRPFQNDYLEAQIGRRQSLMIQICLDFGEKGHLSREDVLAYTQ